MFIDEVQIQIIAGKGGDGCIAWRREKYIPKGGPRGGNGGDGGSVFFQTDANLNTLSDFRHKKVFKAKSGQNGGTKNMNGEFGENLIIKVPVGTIVKDLDSGEIVADLDKQNLMIKIAEGGRGGYGNSHFVSSTRQAPGFAELGDIGEQKNIGLELKLVADIGIIGIPSAGKSSLINSLSNVRAKVGDYEFTTLNPNLGVMDHKGKSLVLEDVPGLIPGASAGKGLGIKFLKHIERTGILLHLVDLYRLDQCLKDYENIRKELELFSKELASKEEIIILSKADLVDDGTINLVKEEFLKSYPGKTIFAVSSATNYGLEELKNYLIENYSKNIVEEKAEEIKVFDLKGKKDPNFYKIDYLGDLQFKITGERIEQIVRMTDFTNPEAVDRVYDVLEKNGSIEKISKKLEKIFEKIDNIDSYFFEGGESNVDFTPKVLIGNKILNLDKLKYNL